MLPLNISTTRRHNFGTRAYQIESPLDRDQPSLVEPLAQSPPWSGLWYGITRMSPLKAMAATLSHLLCLCCLKKTGDGSQTDSPPLRTQKQQLL
jgi:hypothetical protein